MKSRLWLGEDSHKIGNRILCKPTADDLIDGRVTNHIEGFCFIFKRGVLLWICQFISANVVDVQPIHFIAVVNLTMISYE
jgi:hypothetical protein